jgi:hypothetical protein
MQRGFILDRAGHGLAAAAWVDGAPVPSLWFGLKLKGKRQIPVSADRCTACGFLEFYAR